MPTFCLRLLAAIANIISIAAAFSAAPNMPMRCSREWGQHPAVASIPPQLHRGLGPSFLRRTGRSLPPRDMRLPPLQPGFALSAEAAGSATTTGFQTYFGDYVVRSFEDADTERTTGAMDQLGTGAMDQLAACRNSGGEVLVVVSIEEDIVVAGAGARLVAEDSSGAEALVVSAGGAARRELLTFLVRCLEAACRQRTGLSRLSVPGDTHALLHVEALQASGYNLVDGALCKPLSAAGAESGGRAGEKGSKELLCVVDTEGRQVAVLPRAYVEDYNLLIPAIGVIVHNERGEIYVHERSATKSMHASYFDMMVGGLPLADESPLQAARNEAKEELGVGKHDHDDKVFEQLFTVTWLGARNRVILTIFIVCVEQDDEIEHDDGEVVWGKFMSLEQLNEKMSRDKFVPGGLKAWQETVDRGLHTKYLK